MPQLVLASTSPYRRELLTRLQIPFIAVAPLTDESELAGETPVETADRLAEAKARAIAEAHPLALIVGSDQVAFVGGQRFGKPNTRANAMRQLQQMRGREIIFHTSVCLLNSQSGRVQRRGVQNAVGFRNLRDDEIEAYLDKEDALNCAGSAKSEGLGISLLSYLRGDDPNALVGLPLIALCDMLRAEGIPLP